MSGKEVWLAIDVALVTIAIAKPEIQRLVYEVLVEALEGADDGERSVAGLSKGHLDEGEVP